MNNLTNKSEKRSGWTVWIIIVAISTTIGGSLPVGYHMGVINAPALIIQDYCNASVYNHYGTVLSTDGMNILWSAIVSIFLVGGVTGSLSGSYLADKFGRKYSYIISTVLNVVAGILFFICKYVDSFEILIIGRLLAGLAGGLITCVVPMYLTELAPLHLRGSVGVLCLVGITAGLLVGQVMGLREILGTEETWQELLAFPVLLVFACSLVLPFFPESPKYLYVVRKNHQAALEDLSKIRGMPVSYITEEIDDLQNQENNQNSYNTWNLSTVIRDRRFLLPLLLMCATQAGQQFCGINAVFYYSVSIFRNAGLSEKASQLATIGTGAVNSFMATLSIYLMSICNRRSVFMFSCLTVSIFLIILGLSITFIDAVSWMPYICIAACLGYVFFFQFGLGPIPYFIGSELFETGPRSSAMALGSMANWGCNFIVGMTFPTMQHYIGASSFYIFAVITLLVLIFIRQYLPETHGRDPGEVAILCAEAFSSRPLTKVLPTRNADTDIKNSEKSV